MEQKIRMRSGRLVTLAPDQKFMQTHLCLARDPARRRNQEHATPRRQQPHETAGEPAEEARAIDNPRHDRSNDQPCWSDRSKDDRPALRGVHRADHRNHPRGKQDQANHDRAQRGMDARARRLRAQAFDLLDNTRSRGAVQAMRTHERPDELSRALTLVRPVSEQTLELAHVLVETPGEMEQSSFDTREMLKME